MSYCYHLLSKSFKKNDFFLNILKSCSCHHVERRFKKEIDAKIVKVELKAMRK